MNGIRELTYGDLPELGRVYEETVGRQGLSREVIERSYTETFPKLFLEPFPEADCSPSLVYVEDGTIRGFVGVGRRPLDHRGRRVWAAVTSQLFVSPGARASLAGVRLLQAVFAGPQALTFADRSIPAGRKSLRAAGAENLPCHSLRWTKPLRPGLLRFDRLVRQLPLGPVAEPLRRSVRHRSDGPIGARFRSVVAGDPAPPPDTLTAGPLTVDDVVGAAEEVLGHFELRPDLATPGTVEALWDLLRTARPNGEVVRCGIRSRKGALVAWYLVHVNEAGTAEVVQLAARPALQPAVLAFLVRDLRDRGAVRLQGALHPHLVYDLDDLDCTFDGHAASLSVHTDDESLRQTVESGSFYLSSLEGEYLLVPLGARVP